jgi:hypothetical protein
MTGDAGALGLVIQAMQDELDTKDRIIARLTDALESLKGRTLHDLSQMFAPRRRGGQPGFAIARAARLRVQ